MFFRESWALRPCKISRRVSNESGVMWAGTCLYFSSQKRKPTYQKICFSKKHRSDWILFFYPPLAVNHPACWIQRGTPAHFARSEVEKKIKIMLLPRLFRLLWNSRMLCGEHSNKQLRFLASAFHATVPFTILSLYHPLKRNYLRTKQFSFS